MAKVVAAPAVDRDITDIIEYLAREAGWPTATKYLALFDDCFDRTGLYPKGGAPRPKLGRGVRISVVSPYIVVYRYEPQRDIVILLRILHGARRITRKLVK